MIMLNSLDHTEIEVCAPALLICRADLPGGGVDVDIILGQKVCAIALHLTSSIALIPSMLHFIRELILTLTMTGSFHGVQSMFLLMRIPLMVHSIMQKMRLNLSIQLIRSKKLRRENLKSLKRALLHIDIFSNLNLLYSKDIKGYQNRYR